MKSITWIHTADLHLDRPVTGWHGSKEKALQRREDYRETFVRIVSVVKQKNADFLFISGDFLEHNFIQSSTVQFVKECFAEIPSTHILISPGNHDPYRLDSFYYPREDWPKNVHIFSSEWEALHFKEYDLTIWGRGFSDYIETEWVPPHIDSWKGRQIMIAHGTFLSAPNNEGCSYFPVLERELTTYFFDYIALGHIHKPSLIKLKNNKGTLVCYPGSPEALNWKETGERFVVYGTLDSKGVAIEWVPVHSRVYERIVCDISDCSSREEILHSLQRKLSSYDHRSCFQIVLEGRYPIHLDINKELYWLTERLGERNIFHFFLMNEGNPDFDLPFYRKQKGVIGLFVRKMEERMHLHPNKKEEYMQALYKGLEVLCEEK